MSGALTAAAVEPLADTQPIPPSPETAPAQMPSQPPSSTPVAKPGPRRLSAAELASLRERIGRDRARRAQALSREQAAAEQQRRQFEQMASMQEEENWEDETPEPAPNLGEVFLNSLNAEMAKNQAERQAQDAFIRDIQHQQAVASERRQREQEQRRAAAQAPQHDERESGPAPSAVSTARGATPRFDQARAAEIRERELTTQAATERARQQQLRAQTQSGAAAAASGTTGSSAPARPLRFVLTIGLRNKPGDTVNPTCYSNVITRPGPPGWGGPGFLPAGAGDQARAEVYGLRDRFIAQCRASGREITSEGDFGFVWNQLEDGEQRVQESRPRFREDVAVSL